MLIGNGDLIMKERLEEMWQDGCHYVVDIVQFSKHKIVAFNCV